MKILIVGDLHLHTWKYENIQKYQRRLLEEILPSLAEKEEISSVILMGDIFHDKRFIDKQLLSQFTRMLQSLLNKTNIHLVIGNHDLYLGDSLAMDFLSVHKVNIHSELSYTFINGQLFVFIPYTEQLEGRKETLNTRLLELLKKENISSDSIFIFSHVDLKHVPYLPATLNAYSPTQQGIDLNEIAKEVKKSFPDMKVYWFNGHYHTSSTGKFDNISLLNVGSVFGFTASDRNQKKNFVIIDLESKISFLNFKFIPTEAPVIRVITDPDEYRTALQESQKDLSFQPIFAPVRVEITPSTSEKKTASNNQQLDVFELLKERIRTYAEKHNLNPEYGLKLLETYRR